MGVGVSLLSLSFSLSNKRRTSFSKLIARARASPLYRSTPALYWLDGHPARTRSSITLVYKLEDGGMNNFIQKQDTFSPGY